MTWALCFHCGATKFGAISPCDGCGVSTSGDIDLDIAFSDHHFSRATLDQFGAVIQSINAVAPSKEATFYSFILYVAQRYPGILDISFSGDLEANCIDILLMACPPDVTIEPSSTVEAIFNDEEGLDETLSDNRDEEDEEEGEEQSYTGVPFVERNIYSQQKPPLSSIDEALINASIVGDLPTVINAIKIGGNVNCDDDQQETPLFHAAAGGHFKVAQLLIDQGALIDASNNAIVSPLMAAARSGRLSTLKLLAFHGANLEFEDMDFWTPLMWATLNGHDDIVQLLVVRGVAIDAVERRGNSALMIAAIGGYANLTRLLINHGADVNRQDLLGNTALSRAREFGHDDVIEILLHSGGV